MSALALRRGVVVSIDRLAPDTAITVDVAGEQRPAIAYVDLTGPVEEGDEVVVNVAARDLGLGSGGFDIVHANLTRGLSADGPGGAHVMKLNYTSLQHAVDPLEERAGDLDLPLDRAVAVVSLHAQLPCVAWALAEARPGTRLGYVQTAGGALPGALSRNVRVLCERGLLAGHVTAGPAFGGEHDAVTVAGALHTGLTALSWDAAVVGPGPGILGSPFRDGAGDIQADGRIVDRLFAVRAAILDRVPEPRQRLRQVLLEREARVIGADRDAHARDCTIRTCPHRPSSRAAEPTACAPAIRGFTGRMSRSAQ